MNSRNTAFEEQIRKSFGARGFSNYEIEFMIGQYRKARKEYVNRAKKVGTEQATKELNQKANQAMNNLDK